MIENLSIRRQNGNTLLVRRLGFFAEIAFFNPVSETLERNVIPVAEILSQETLLQQPMPILKDSGIISHNCNRYSIKLKRLNS